MKILLNGREGMNKMELLAPAGSIEALEAAVESGADAVYIGGSKFNARAFAHNLDEDMLKRAVEYAHIRGSKVYIAVNILILQKELEEVLEYIYYLYNINADAVIVQDIGLAIMIRRLLPDFEVHCSTQMAVHNTDGAKYLSAAGIKRVVLARELTLSEVDNIALEADINAEIFGHGALCVSYSGQCYMSSMIGGRSGNRGKCAQPCRKKYRIFDKSKEAFIEAKGSHLISTMDLNTYENLEDIMKANVASLKIEGRMKRPEYVAIIVKNYRDAIDCIIREGDNCITDEAQYELLIAFNREFTKGYLFGQRNQDIVSTERPDNRGIYIGKILSQKGNIAEIKLENNYLNDGDGIEIVNSKGKTVGCIVSGIKRNGETVKKAAAGDRVRIYINDKAESGSIVNKTLDRELFEKAAREYSYTNRKKIELEAVFYASIGKKPVLEVKDKAGNYVKAIWDEVVQKAERQAVTEQKVLEQLNKTGDTPYSFADIKVIIESDSFLALKTINNLRRNALEQLNYKRIEIANRNRSLDIKREISLLMPMVNNNQRKFEAEIIAGIRNIESAEAAILAGANTIYILGDYNYRDSQKLIEAAAELCKQKGISLYYVLPQITRNHEVAHLESMLKEVLSKWKNIGIVVSNIGHLPLAKRLEVKDIRGNFSLNVTNAASVNHLNSEGLGCICMSPELSLTQIKELAYKSTAELEGIVYGYLPVMVTEYCPNSAVIECSSCRREGFRDYGIVDERDKFFEVINLGNCRNLILNSDVLCVFDNLSSIINSGVSKLRLDFYVENKDEIYDITLAYRKRMQDLEKNNENDTIKRIKDKGFTKGHYFRGID